MCAGVIWFWTGKMKDISFEPSCYMKNGEILDQPSSCELLHMSAAEHRHSIA